MISIQPTAIAHRLRDWLGVFPLDRAVGTSYLSCPETMTNPYDIAFFETFAEEEAALRRYLPPSLRCSFLSAPIPIREPGPPPARLLCIRTQSRIPAAWRAHTAAVLTRSTGYDHLLPLRNGSPPMALAALPEYCTRAVAEHAMLLWTSLLRRLPRQLSQMPRFDREGLTGSECAGRRIAVVGVGRIGYEIARIARGLDMSVVGVDLLPRHPDIEYHPFKEAVQGAAVVVCAMNLTAQNCGYFDAAHLASLEPSAVFVNIARGELSPPAPLLQGLNTGRLAGVGLDVFDGEAELADQLRHAGRTGLQPPWSELFAHPGFLATPHNAFNTLESVDRKSQLTVEQIQYWMSHGCFKWPLPEHGCATDT